MNGNNKGIIFSRGPERVAIRETGQKRYEAAQHQLTPIIEINRTATPANRKRENTKVLV